MAQTRDADARPPRRVRLWAVFLLALSIALACLLVTVSYGLAREYGDTEASAARIAAQSFRFWGLGVILVLVVAWATAMTARRSRGRQTLTVIAAAAVMATLIGLPAGAVLGVHQKRDAYPDLPSCGAEFRAGPAVPVVRAAQAGFAELDHPGPFSGGGSSGIDGCATQLMVAAQVDVPAAYRRTLGEAGWEITEVTSHSLVAERDAQAFEVTREAEGSWWVWIGPAGLAPAGKRAGEVAPRR